MRRDIEVLGALLALLVVNLGWGMPVQAQGPPAPTVSVAQPVAKRITIWDEYSGRFEAVETVEVRPRVSGFVDKVKIGASMLAPSSLSA